jgi:tetratricopeptide (TPR) repeat protein
MSLRPPLPVALACLIALAGSASAQEKPGRVAEEVSPKTQSVIWYEVRDGKMVSLGTFDPQGAMIVREEPEYFQVLWRGRRGWVKRDDVLVGTPRDAYFAERVKQSPSDVYALRYCALMSQRAGHVNEALAFIDEAIRLRPNDVQSHQIRSTLLMVGKQDTAGSLSELDLAERIDPANSDTAIHRASVWLARKEFDKAKQEFDRAIRLAPDDPMIYQLRAHLWRLQGDTAKAVADLDTALRLWPDCVAAHIRRANLLLAGPDPDGSRAREAAASARRVCELTRWEDVAQVRLLARACEQAGDAEGARRCREKVEEMRRPDADNLPPLPPPPAPLPLPPQAPEGPPPTLPATVDRKDKLVGTDVIAKTGTVGWYELRDGQVVRGGTFNNPYGTIVGTSPDCFLIRWCGREGWVCRADVVACNNESPQYFFERVRQYPSDAYAQRVCADALLAANMESSAAPYVEAAVRLAPNDLFAHRTRAVYLAYKGDRAGAEDELRAAARIDPSDPMIPVVRAMAIWWAQKEYDKAAAEFEKAVRLAPNDERIAWARAGFWLDKGDAARALADFDACIRLRPDYLGAHAERAELLMKASDPSVRNPKEAVVSARRACELTRWENAEHLKRLARACEAAGYNDEAARWREKAGQVERDSAAQLPPLPPAKP